MSRSSSTNPPDNTLLLPEKKLYEEGYQYVAGIDEAGRGCLAGPVVASAVILPVDELIPGVNDSKKLSPAKRQTLLQTIQEKAICVTTSHASPREIEKLNILHAALTAMQRSVDRLEPVPDFLLIDGNRAFPTLIPHKALVKGDARSQVIAAASIVAKVKRDQHMVELHEEYPQYGWAQHKGYPTRAHYKAIAEHGPSPHHRRTFRLYKD